MSDDTYTPPADVAPTVEGLLRALVALAEPTVTMDGRTWVVYRDFHHPTTLMVREVQAKDGRPIGPWYAFPVTAEGAVT